MINDGSTEPHIEELLKQAEQEDSRFKYIYKPNSGVSDTRNLGIDMAQGEYIVFVDTDDYLEPDALRYMLNVAQSRDESIVVFGFCDNDVYNDRKELKKHVDVDESFIISFIGGRMGQWFSNGISFASPWSKIYRREAICRSGIHFLSELSIGEDIFFNLCFMQYVKSFCVDNRLVYHYVTNPESATHTFFDSMVRDAKNRLSKLDDFVALNYKDVPEIESAVNRRALWIIDCTKEQYFTHPKNTKSFWVLKKEMHDFLSLPIMKRHIRKLRLSDARNKIERKHIILLKLRLFWIFLITERRKRRKLVLDSYSGIKAKGAGSHKV